MTAASKIRTDYEQLAQIAGEFGQQAESTQALLASLKEHVEILQGGDWVGKGSDSFYQEMHSSVLPMVNRLAEAMREAASTTTRISQVMKRAEEEAAALFRLDGAGLDAPGSSPAASIPSPAAPQPGPAPAAAFAGDGPAGVSPGPGSGGAGRTAAAPVDPRAAKVQPLLDEGRHLQEMYDDTVAERKKREAKYKEAIKLKKSEREILRLKAELKAMQNAEKFYEEDLTAKFNEAAQLAIKLYNIDMSAVRGKPQYSHVFHSGAETDHDRTITLYRDSVAHSPGWLASTLGHEAMHARQMKEGRIFKDDEDIQGLAMNEVESYQWQLDNARAYGLTQHEVDMLKRLRQDEYDKLEPKNKQRVNRGIYTPG